MNVFLSGILNFMQAYGYAAFGASIFVAAMGVPLPPDRCCSPRVPSPRKASSMWRRCSRLPLAPPSAATAQAISSAGSGEAACSIGCRARASAGTSSRHSRATARSRHYFRRHGASAVFLTRWLLVWFAGATNLVAGTELYPFRSFLVWDVTGEVLGAVIPLALGFAFGASWEAAAIC